MSSWTFSVADGVFERFPDYVVGWVTARFEPETADIAAIEQTLRVAEVRANSNLAGKDLKENPAIGVWRSAFSTLGWSASKYPSSTEALAKRAARGMPLPAIHPAVDLVNAVSLTYLAPIGCHNVSSIPGLTVRPSTDGDTFLPMGEGEAETPPDGELVYVSGSDVRTRRWVWRQSRLALVGADASWIFCPVDGFADTTLANVEGAVGALSTLMRDMLGATVESGMVTRTQSSAKLTSARD